MVAAALTMWVYNDVSFAPKLEHQTLGLALYQFGSHDTR